MYGRGMTRREREITDINQIKTILDTCKVLPLGLVDGDKPYVVPMNYGYIMADGKLTVYLHASTIGHKLDLMRANPNVFFEMLCNAVPFEGDVACRYGLSYESLMARGTAVIVDDVEEKKKALTMLMKTQTGKDFEFEDRLTIAVSVIKIDVTEYTAKRRPMPEKKPE